MDAGDASLENFGRDEFPDLRSNRRAGVGRVPEVGDDGTEDASDDAAAAGVTHTQGMGGEEDDGLEDAGIGEDERAHRGMRWRLRGGGA